jgi:hypothetical protein
MAAHFPQPRGKVSRSGVALAVLFPIACAGAILALVTFGGGKSKSAGSTSTDGTGLAAYQACLAQHGVSESVPQGQSPSQAQVQAFTDCRGALGVDPSQSGGGGSGSGGFASRQEFDDCVYAAGMKAEASGQQGSDEAVDQAVEQCREKLGMNFGGPPQTQTQTTTPGSIA